MRKAEPRASSRKPAGRRRATFRKAREEDLERLLEIHLRAYPDARSVAARERTFTRDPYGGIASVVVLERGGIIDAQAFLLPLRSSFGGRAVTMSGIASLAVAAECRGQGLGTALMNHLHGLSDARGDALTMLYAYRQGFYARFGYSATSSRKRLAIDSRSVPDSWRALAHDRVRPARGGDRAAIRNVYVRAGARSSGWISRPARYWEQLFARERLGLMVAQSEGGTVSGYVAFLLTQEHAHAETVLEVEELVVDDHETRRALVGALASLRDQASEIHLEVPESDPIERALIDPDGRRYGTETVEHSLGDVVGGPMIRIEDIPRALEARGYVGSGSFDVVVRDRERVEPGSAVEHVLAAGVRVEGGRAEVGPARGGGALVTTRAGLAAIFYGGLGVADAVGLGLAEVDARIADRLAAVARIAPIGPVDAF